MGCGLRKIRQTEDSSPGKIYSTLKKPQVETEVGVAYTYCHLDFLVGKEDGTSTLCLSSVRELPSQLQELYQQGFVLAAVHPFVHPCGPELASVQRQLYRALLIRHADSSEKRQADCKLYHLKLEECLSADQIPSPELIQGYVKKQIQDAADQGIMFAGFIQEPAGIHRHVTRRGEPEEPSLSLHSSLSSLHGSGLERSPSPGPPEEQQHGAEPRVESPGDEGSMCEDGGLENGGRDVVSEDMPGAPKADPSEEDLIHPQEGTEEETLSLNNNKASTEPSAKPSRPSLSKRGADLFGLYNYPGQRESQLKYYTVKVPLKVHPRVEGIRGVEANWLDHMTQHFNSGAWLVDGYFHLGNDSDPLPKAVESVFIFQEGSESESATSTAYDAIVVEQWSVINGVQVKTDYLPLLQSLATYGWRLTCVLPTPVIKTNSDGSLATKQIVFLQRPVLPRKKRESKKLIFKTRNKSGKNSVKDAPKNKKKKNFSSTVEKEIDDQRACDGLDKTPEVSIGCVHEREENWGGGNTISEVETSQKGSMTMKEKEEESKEVAETEEECVGVEQNEEVPKEEREVRIEEGEGGVDRVEQEQEMSISDKKMEEEAKGGEKNIGELGYEENDEEKNNDEDENVIIQVKEEHREELCQQLQQVGQESGPQNNHVDTQVQ